MRKLELRIIYFILGRQIDVMKSNLKDNIINLFI